MLGVAYANRCGSMGTIVSRTVLNIADSVLPGELPGPYLGADHIYRDADKLVKIPPAFLFAVTASTVHVFDVRMVMGNTKIKKELAVFDRAGLEIESEEQTLVITYRMVAPQRVAPEETEAR